MGIKKKRKRITKPVEEIDVIVDESAYRENACSQNAKYITNFNEKLNIEFWIDKHYSVRDLERIGIGLDVVQALVSKAFIHFHYYSSKHNFIFINHPPSRERNTRVVIQQVYPKNEKLNVVVEYHFIKLNTFEVTVVTAICKDHYTLFDGQYAIEFHENSSILYFNEKRNTNQVDDYTE